MKPNTLEKILSAALVTSGHDFTSRIKLRGKTWAYNSPVPYAPDRDGTAVQPEVKTEPVA